MTSDKLASWKRTVPRLYIPAVYVDEISPLGRVSPDAWIGSPIGDLWLLAADEDCDLGLTLKPGKIVEFIWVEDFGEIAVEICDDGTHVAQCPVPHEASHLSFQGDLDSLADSLDDFVRQWRDHGMEIDPNTVLIVQMCRWSPSNEHYRFEIGTRGPQFVMVEDPYDAVKNRDRP